MTSLCVFSQTLDAFAKATDELYGNQQNQCFRSFAFGVKPGCQGRGIGKAIHNYTVREAQKAGAKFFFTCNHASVPLYEALGCTAVKRGITVDGAKALAGYPAGSEVCAVMEAGEPV